MKNDEQFDDAVERVLGPDVARVEGVWLDSETLSETITCLSDWYIMMGNYPTTRAVIQKLRDARDSK